MRSKTSPTARNDACWPLVRSLAVGWSPLHYAAHHDSAILTRVLLEHRALVGLRTSGAYRHHTLSFRPVLTCNAVVSSERHGFKTALEMAAQKGHVHVARILIQYGADPNEHYDDGLTAHDLLRLGDPWVSDTDRKLDILQRWATTPTPAPSRTPLDRTIVDGLGSSMLHGEV